MLRSGVLLAASVIGLLPTTVRAVDVTAEMTKILQEYSAQTTLSRTDREAFAQAIEKRNKALTDLAAAAEAEQSVQHGPLARVYAMLQRHDDAVRHAGAAIAAGEDGPVVQTVLVTSLAGAGRLDEAEAALRKLMAKEMPADGAVAFIAATMPLVNSVASRQVAAEKIDAAEKLLDDWTAKVAANRNDSEEYRQAVERSQRAIDFLRSRIASQRALAAMIGMPYFPLSEPTWLNGESISPEQLHGKVVLLDFWAVWCGPCIATFPHLIEWHEKYADKGLVIIGVTRRYQFDWNAAENRPEHVAGLEPAADDAATEKFAAHHGLKHRLAIMPNDDASRQYKANAIPQVVLIDANGIIRMIKVGGDEEKAAAVEAEIRKLLGIQDETAKKE